MTTQIALLRGGRIKKSIRITIEQGRGNYSEVGEGGKRLLGFKVTPTQNNILKKSKFSPLFIGETQVNVQKQTKINMNDTDRPKLEATRLPSWRGELISSK